MPKLYLTIDNCFASKRWTKPEEWARRISELGLRYVEASADTENDPLYHGETYRQGWIEEVKAARDATGIEVANLYSGHGTYSTLGISHTEPMVIDRLVSSWLAPQIDTAAALGAGLGFFMHAFPISTLESPAAYLTAKESLYDTLAKVATLAGEKLRQPVGVEQMYSPHQVPWTIAGGKELLAEVSERSDTPIYLTLDVGHQSGQAKFTMPDLEDFRRTAELIRSRSDERLPWLGVEQGYDLARACASGQRGEQDAWEELADHLEGYPYLFSSPEDADPYRWLEELGAYSPIVHLQQTDGRSSSHAPFTPTQNEKGIITGPEVLSALSKSYDTAALGGVVEPVEDLYLTLEVFFSTASNPYSALDELAKSVEYWRAFIPEDGIELSDAVSRLARTKPYETGGRKKQ